MSESARIFGEGYRGEPLKVEKRLGLEHLVPGQMKVQWVDDEHDGIEVSYVHKLGHAFIVVMLAADTLDPIAAMKADVFGAQEVRVPTGFKVDDEIKTAIARLRTKDVTILEADGESTRP